MYNTHILHIYFKLLNCSFLDIKRIDAWNILFFFVILYKIALFIILHVKNVTEKSIEFI